MPTETGGGASLPPQGGRHAASMTGEHETETKAPSATLSTYLFFEDNCAEAFEFYRSVFGGDFMSMMTFADGPPDLGVSDSEKDRIMHVSLPVGDAVLMGSDNASSFGPPRTAGDNFAVSYTAPTRDDADRVFAALFDGGEATVPMQDMFWGSYFGQGTDRFGIGWMISHDQDPQE